MTSESTTKWPKRFARPLTTRSIKRGSDAGEKTVALALPDPRMSTHHARLSRSGDGWIIEDLGSMNGTMIGALRIKKRPLEDGDGLVLPARVPNEGVLSRHIRNRSQARGARVPDASLRP